MKSVSKKTPTVQKVRNKYRIQVMLNGKRYSTTKDTEQACLDWYHLLCDEHISKSISLLELFELYRSKVLVKHKCIDRANGVISKMVREHTDLVTTDIDKITPKQLADYRDYRLLLVSHASVLLELSLLSCVFNFAVKELYLLDDNPMDKVTKPNRPNPRDRRISKDEETKIIEWSRYKLGEVPDTCRKQVGWCFLFALQTAMRRSEIMSLTSEHIHPNHVHIPYSKNGTSRNVPLNSTAKLMLKDVTPLSNKLFNIREDNFNLIWRRMRQQLDIKDLHFHDTRHEAITRMVRDLNIPVEKLAKVTGHKSINILVNTYYNPTVDELSSYFTG